MASSFELRLPITPLLLSTWDIELVICIKSSKSFNSGNSNFFDHLRFWLQCRRIKVFRTKRILLPKNPRTNLSYRLYNPSKRVGLSGHVTSIQMSGATRNSTLPRVLLEAVNILAISYFLSVWLGILSSIRRHFNTKICAPCPRASAVVGVFILYEWGYYHRGYSQSHSVARNLSFFPNVILACFYQCVDDCPPSWQQRAIYCLHYRHFQTLQDS